MLFFYSIYGTMYPYGPRSGLFADFFLKSPFFSKSAGVPTHLHHRRVSSPRIEIPFLIIIRIASRHLIMHFIDERAFRIVVYGLKAVELIELFHLKTLLFFAIFTIPFSEKLETLWDGVIRILEMLRANLEDELAFSALRRL